MLKTFWLNYVYKRKIHRKSYNLLSQTGAVLDQSPVAKHLLVETPINWYPGMQAWLQTELNLPSLVHLKDPLERVGNVGHEITANKSL